MKIKVSDIVRHVLLAFLSVIWLVPIVWLLATSFSKYTGMNSSTFFPEEWSLANYVNLLFGADSVAQFPRWFWNTFIIAVFTCIISTAFVLMVAYATSCMRFKGRKTLMNISVIINLFPGVLAMIAVYFILRSISLTNSHIGMIIVYSAGSGLGYLIAKGFLDTVPVSLREAAYLDGAGEWRVLFSIVLPMVRNVFMTVVLLRFIYYWNDYEIPLLYLPNQPVLARGVYELSISTELNAVPQRLAGCMVLLIPIMAIYLVSSKQLFGNISMGGLKE